MAAPGSARTAGGVAAHGGASRARPRGPPHRRAPAGCAVVALARGGGRAPRPCLGHPRRAAGPDVRVRAPGDRRPHARTAHVAGRPGARRRAHRISVPRRARHDGPAVGAHEAQDQSGRHPLRRPRVEGPAAAAHRRARRDLRRLRHRVGRRGGLRLTQSGSHHRSAAPRRGRERGCAGRTRSSRTVGPHLAHRSSSRCAPQPATDGSCRSPSRTPLRGMPT